MSGLDLKGTLFYLPEEVGAIFRRDKQWAYKAAGDLLKSAVRRFGRKQTLFLKAEVDRIALEGITPRARKKHVAVKTAKRHDGIRQDDPDTKDPETGGASDA